ncbi:MAG: Subtilisin-like serine protease [Enterovirga sp.]|nr:Subtilisin-like serine protease [Enterovirga sp.]
MGEGRRESDEARGLEPQRPVPTGGMLVLLREGAQAQDARQLFRDAAGLDVVDARDFRSSASALATTMSAGAALFLPTLGIAVLPEPKGTDAEALSTRIRGEDAVQDVRPEFYLFAIGDGIQSGPAYADTAARTWGVAATGADQSRYTGRGIKIAILDTGIARNHPDFAGRTITTMSFVPGEDVADGQGHGTHCAGTAAGLASATTDHPRYGVAPDAELYVGKVLNNAGSGQEGWILAGMEWATASKCEVISMSLGRPVRRDEPAHALYEEAGQRALANGCLVVAAAGNNSSRQFSYIAPVAAPANAVSIMAVAAVDQKLGVAEFSCGGVNPDGGQIDIAGPGVGVFSSVPLPQRYMSLRGTSMACPHVAGIAALWAESDPNLRGRALFDALKRHARPLGQPPEDVGSGLAVAPGLRVT